MRGGVMLCFNTQPPEGGWFKQNIFNVAYSCFNTQPPEGGWTISTAKHKELSQFQHTAA